MPKLIPIQKLCTSPEILDHMSHMSGFAPHGFICTNINVRIDFPSLSLQNKFNLPFHQDFLYANEFVTPTKSYVLWLSLLDETRKTGGLRFVTDISEINGLIVSGLLLASSSFESATSTGPTGPPGECDGSTCRHKQCSV